MIEGKTITVESLEDHTYDGVPKPAGTRYEAEEGHVDFLVLRGFARPVTSTTPVEDDVTITRRGLGGTAPAPPPPKPTTRKR